MDKKEYLKKAKLFLKMAEADFAIIKVVKFAKLLLNAALLINSAAFAIMIFFGVKKVKA